MIEFDYTLATRPVKARPEPAAPPRIISHLADTLENTNGAIRIPCPGKDDIELLKIQARLNGLQRKYDTPWSIATLRVVEDEIPVMYAWAVPLRGPRKPRNGGR